MKRGIGLVSLSLVAACATSASSAGPRVSLDHGQQLKLWGVEARLETDTLSVDGQVSRTALPRGPLVEHVHVEVLNEAGAVIAMDDAAIYPITALRGGQGQARIKSRLPGSAGGHLVQVRVVKGMPHE